MVTQGAKRKMNELSRSERAYLLKEAVREVLDDPARRDDLKAAFKQALTEWLNEQWATFGKWTFRGLAAMAFTGILYLFAKAKGLL